MPGLHRRRALKLQAFDLEKLFEPELAELTATPGLLEATERCHRIEVAAVDVDLTGPHSARDALCMLRVRRPDTAREPVDGVICNADGVLLVFVGQDAQDRAKDFLLCNLHRVFHVPEHRWLDEVALGQALWLLRPSRDESRPFLDAFADVPAHSLF